MNSGHDVGWARKKRSAHPTPIAKFLISNGKVN
jgi:hypothetical protein